MIYKDKIVRERTTYTCSSQGVNSRNAQRLVPLAMLLPPT